MHDVESRRRENLQAQAEAFMPADHLITLQYYSLLRFFVRELTTTFGSLQLCPEIIDILYPDCHQFIESCFQRFSSISKHNAVRQTVQCIFITVLAQELIRR